jgi:hypothetical protein
MEKVIVGIVCIVILFFVLRAAGLVCISGCGSNKCGNDDCGRSCGKCDADHTCQAGQCVLKNNCGDRECGNDRYGNICGTCDGQQTCQNGYCMLPPPPPGPHTDDDTLYVCPEDSSVGKLKWYINMDESPMTNVNGITFTLKIVGMDSNYVSYEDYNGTINAELYNSTGNTYYYRNSDELPYDPRRITNSLTMFSYSSQYNTTSLGGTSWILDPSTC